MGEPGACFDLYFDRFDGLMFKTENPFEKRHNGPFQSAGYSLELLTCVAEETVAPFAVPRTGSKVALRHQNAGPEMGPFPKPSRNVPILRGTENGSEFRANF